MSTSVLTGPATRQPVRGEDLFGLTLPESADRPALVTATESLTYADLVARVCARSATLGTTRRLVLLEAANDTETVTTYLAALAGRHPVLMVEPGGADKFASLVETYDPDVVQTAGGGPHEVRPGTSHQLHPDLALLLSTSGSTGSPKLVRLSRENLEANARSIASYLAIRHSDRAMTSLPLHYCYGLSVLHSHLISGAGVVLTDLSVADECFWDLFRAAGATTLAGVPHTFELLDASGFERRDLPTLRYLTQAGGRLRPEQVTHYAELGARRGWELFVMYGQTEATARLTYLPPGLASAHPESIGIPVPGGHLRLEPVEGVGAGVGELVYAGPNVMMGYAHDPSDLASGPQLIELRTGDLGRQDLNGLWEIVGRRGRVAKVFGLRIDLDRVERQLAEQGLSARAVSCEVGGSEQLTVFLDRPRQLDHARHVLASVTGLPSGVVRVSQLEQMPLTSAGKVDYAALTHQAAVLAQAATEQPSPHGPSTPADIRDLYATLLGRPDATIDDSFVSLGGDSLSYVEVSLRLSQRLGDLPSGWQLRSATQLAELARPRRRWTAVEPAVWLRALAIVLVVASHADVIAVPGGAHALLALAGFNLARFQLPVQGRATRMCSILSATWRVALPTMTWIAAVGLATGAYRPVTAMLLNGVVGSDTWNDQWQFWFLEALVWTLAGTALLLGTPFLDRLERARPVGFAAALLLAALACRYAWTGVEAGATERYTPGVVAWCFALGWLAGVVSTRGQRLLVALVALGACYGFFGDLQRELVVAGSVAVLVWGRPILVPRPVATVLATVAGASLYIYLTHWQVYPWLEVDHPVLAVVASLLVGCATWALVSRVRRSSGLPSRGPGRSVPGAGRPSRPRPPGHRTPCAGPRG